VDYPILRSHDELSSPAEMISQERSNPGVSVFGCLCIVFQPVAKHYSTRLKGGDIKRMVSAGVGD
jgi:hypothetical protein